LTDNRGSPLTSAYWSPGYSLVHAYGAAFDNPDLIVACVIGDGEAETGPLAARWHSSKFLNPARDGAVLPILHLNGYKIANPTVLARIPHSELESLLTGYGYTVYTVAGDDPKVVHQQLAATMDAVIGQIRAIWRRAREDGDLGRPAWPAIVLKTPKGWTGPKVVDGLPVEGTWRAVQPGSQNQLRKAVTSKMRKRFKDGLAYWELPHIRDLPFVLAIQSFYGESSTAFTGALAASYLLGRNQAWLAYLTIQSWLHSVPSCSPTAVPSRSSIASASSSAMESMTSGYSAMASATTRHLVPSQRRSSPPVRL
jgi:hypothetical protein